MDLRAFVINLHRRPDRWRHMQRQLEQQKVAYERVAAADGQRLAAFGGKVRRNAHGFPVTLSEIGCMVSHRKAWRQFLRSGAEVGLILEDDVKIGRGLREVLAAGLPELADQWLINCETRFNLLQLLHDIRPLSDRRHRLCQIYASVGAGGYLINRKGAESLLAHLREIHPVDHLLFGRQNGLPWHPVPVYQLDPAFVVPDELLSNRSDIETERRDIRDMQRQSWARLKPRGWHKLLREFLRLRCGRARVSFH